MLFPAGVMHVLPSEPLRYTISYTPVGDLAVVAVCFVIFAMLFFSYARRTRGYRIFLFIVPCLTLSALLNVTYHFLLSSMGPVPLVSALHILHHAALFSVFFLFTLYIAEVTHLETGRKKRVTVAASVLLAGIVVADLIRSITGARHPDASAGIAFSSQILFPVGYVLFIILDLLLLVSVRKRLYRSVMRGFYASIVIAVTVLLLQALLNSRSSSFTVVTFLFPVIAMLYIMHSNPYDAETGTLSGSFLTDIVRNAYEKKKPFIFLSVYLPFFDGGGKSMPDAIKSLVRTFASDYFHGAILLQLNPGLLMLLFRKNRNPDYEHRIGKMLRAFQNYHRIYQYDYKIVIGESVPEISRKNEYYSFIRDINRKMDLNSIRRVGPDDILSFGKSEYILRQLEDIHKQHNLDDRRVLVFCQPVFNIRTNRYDTAEALMRLQLDDLGLVPPDRFISLAEEHGYIHTLTEIILHKTCGEIRRLTDAGFDIQRISVNVSMLELKDEHFCSDISAIISRSGVPGDKIAIELTESRSESDFNLMKDRIVELKERGIKFYLDDFGTGYSNMERIIELPFDIIKFDRSLVVACGTNQRSEKIVSNMATLFSDLDYSVLYEGVETDTDESLCCGMCASYLQGFKYSRPIPITDLRRFVPRKDKAG